MTRFRIYSLFSRITPTGKRASVTGRALAGATALLLALIAVVTVTAPARAQSPDDYSIDLLSLPPDSGMWNGPQTWFTAVDKEGTIYFDSRLADGSAYGTYVLSGGQVAPLILSGDEVVVYLRDTTTTTLTFNTIRPIYSDAHGRVVLQGTYFEPNSLLSHDYLLRIEADDTIHLLDSHVRTHGTDEPFVNFYPLPNGSWARQVSEKIEGVWHVTMQISDGASTHSIGNWIQYEKTACAYDPQLQLNLQTTRTTNVGSYTQQGDLSLWITEETRGYERADCTGNRRYDAYSGMLTLPGGAQHVVWSEAIDRRVDGGVEPPTHTFLGGYSAPGAATNVYTVMTQWPSDSQYYRTLRLYRDTTLIRTANFTDEESERYELEESDFSHATVATDGTEGVWYSVRPGGTTAAGLYRDSVLIVASNDPRLGVGEFRFWRLGVMNAEGVVLAEYLDGGAWKGTVRITPGREISGTITQDVFPLAGIVVWATDLQSGAEITSTTNATGAYSFLGLAQGTYRVEPVHDDYDFMPRNAEITVAPSDPNVSFAADFAPDNLLRPQPDGLAFENWGGAKYPSDGDLSIADLFSMFGAGVCQSGTTALDCVLTAAARQWRSSELASAAGGHCAGMTSSALRLWTGNELPASYMPNAGSTFALAPTPAVTALVSRYHTLQSLKPLIGADGWLANYGEGHTPNQILEMIRTNLKDDMLDPLYLGFRMDGKGGHAVTPFKVAYKGKEIFHVYVYDSNWPGNEDRYLIFDSKANTWRYALGAVKPDVAPSPWFGDSGTQSLRLRQASLINPTGLFCSFCPPGGAMAAEMTGQSAMLAVRTQGALPLLQNGSGAATGWSDGAYVNQIAGAEILHVDNGTELEVAPTILAPADGKYTLSLRNVFTASTGGGFSVLGAGYGAGVEDVEIAPGASLQSEIGADGRSVRFVATATAPTLFVLDDLDAHSHRIEIQPLAIATGSTIALGFDPQSGTVAFGDNDPAVNTYALQITRITASGKVEIFQNHQVLVQGTASVTADVTGWGEAGALTLVIGGVQQVIPNMGGFSTWLPSVQR